MGCDKATFSSSVYLAVSIHAPTWGATLMSLILFISIILFQSTHPHGVRRTTGYNSIAEARFNPRTHMGCDAFVSTRMYRSGKFQSTHPHGVRPILKSCKDIDEGFNPRTHMGCDSFQSSFFILTKSFNPRTHMGCDTMMT